MQEIGNVHFIFLLACELSTEHLLNFRSLFNSPNSSVRCIVEAFALIFICESLIVDDSSLKKRAAVALSKILLIMPMAAIHGYRCDGIS